jgi:dienelactone hydrolase
MDKIMTPSSWVTTLVYKPLWVLQTMYHAIPWKMANPPSASQPRVFSFFQALRNAPPPEIESLKIGAAGFCWGGKYTVLLAQDAPSSRSTSGPLIDCGFTAHPSYLNVPEDIEGVTLPLSIAVGDNDMQLKGPQALQTKEILEKKTGGDYEVVIMPGAKHGFAIRTNPEDQLQMECAEKAELQALAWFERWLA